MIDERQNLSELEILNDLHAVTSIIISYVATYYIRRHVPDS